MAVLSEELQVILSAQNRTQAAFNGVTQGLNSLKDNVLKVAAAIGVGLSLKSVVEDTANWAKEVNNLNNVMGSGALSASRLLAVAAHVGLTADELTIAMDRLAKQMFSTSAMADKGKSAFDKWGISLRDANGNVRNGLDIVQQASAKVRAMGDSYASAALEQDLFGRSGGKLHELLMMSKQDFADVIALSDALGTTLDDKALQSLMNFVHAQNDFGQAILALKIQLGEALLPVLTDVIHGFLQWAKEAMPFIRSQVVPFIKTVFELAGGIFNLFWNIGRLIGFLVSAIFNVRTADGVMKAWGEVIRRITGFIKEVNAAIERFISNLGSEGLMKALGDLAGDIGKAVVKFFGDLGQKIDDATGKGTPLDLVLKSILITIGLLIAEKIITGLLGLGKALVGLGSGSNLFAIAAGLVLIDDGLNRIENHKSAGDVLLGIAEISGGAGLFALGTGLIRVGAAMVGIIGAGTAVAILGLLAGGILLIGTDLGGPQSALDKFIATLIIGATTALVIFLAPWALIPILIGVALGLIVSAVIEHWDDIKRVTGAAVAWWGQKFSDFGTFVHGIFETLGTAIGTFLHDYFGEDGIIGKAFSALGTTAQNLFGPDGAIGKQFSNFGTLIHDAIMNINIDFGWVRIDATGFHWNIPTIQLSIGGGGGGGSGGGGVPPPPGPPPPDGCPAGTTWNGFTCVPFGASGGIVTRPTTMLIGEAGPEAVVPLNRGGGMGNTTINVYVSGNITESEQELADMVGERILRSLGANRPLAY
jgi:hypothetical protein